jgi:hypothetical protein
MKSKRIVIGTCAVLVLAFAFMQYVHRGYVGVIDTQDSPKVLRPGFHFRPPWVRVTYYPVVTHEVAIKTSSEGSRGKCKFDVSLQLSVMPDSVASLHKAYGGRYVESLITPLVADFLLCRGSAAEGWSPEAEKVGKALTAHINTAVNPYGIYVYAIWVRTFEVETNLKTMIE